MKTLCFLQNQWFKDPERAKNSLARFEAQGLRNSWIARMLFYKSKTGRVLREVFGEDARNKFIWEECSKNIGGFSASAFPADPQHMKNAILLHKPKIILFFGSIARAGSLKLMGDPDLVPLSILGINGPHPAARQADTLDKLYEMKRRYEEALKQ